MAKITIFEKDVTTAGSGNVTQNVAYVPGYAIMGPLNTPTLCNTLDDFYRTFGNAPYVFKGLQTLGDTTIAISGDYEKSFIYAAELLRSGMPVLFERVGSDTLSYASCTLPINQSAYVATTAQKSNMVTEDLELTESEGNYIYTYANESLKHEVYGIKSETLKITAGDVIITCDENGILSSTNANFKAGESLLDKENGIIRLVFSVAIESSFTIYYDLNEEVEWVVIGKYNTAEDKIDWNLSYMKAGTDELFATQVINIEDHVIVNNGYPVQISSLIAPTGFVLNGSLVKETLADVYAQNVIVARAKYKGTYGDSIKIKLTRKLTHANMFDVTVTFKDEIQQLPVSFSKDSDKYIGNVDFKYVTFIDSKLDEAIIKTSLYNVTEFESKLSSNIASDVDEFKISDMYSQLAKASLYQNIEDRAQYNVKFITSGSYPVYTTAGTYGSIVTNMLKCAGNRGDAIALIDAFDEDPLLLHQSIANLPTDTTADTGEDTRKYGAMIVPSAKYQMQTVSSVLTMPGSFAYLRCAAASGKNSENWYAVSGVTRGLVPNLIELNTRMTGAIADKLQSRDGISINPITYINPYGYCIWGNRTLFNNDGSLRASSFLNIRMLTNDIKKVVYQAARRLTFELNSDVLWLNFRSEVEPTLEKMVSGSGLSGFKIQRVTTDKKATVACLIKLYAVEAIEDWDIHIELNDSYVSVV